MFCLYVLRKLGISCMKRFSTEGYTDVHAMMMKMWAHASELSKRS